MTQEVFNAYIDEATAGGYELTAGALVKIAKQIRDAKQDYTQVFSKIAVACNVAFAMILNGVEEYDKKWLLSEECAFYFETLNLPYEPVRGMGKTWLPTNPRNADQVFT